jgi:hypothetical protein
LPARGSNGEVGWQRNLLVAAIAFGEHVLAQGLDGFARDDAAADGSLDRHREKLMRDQVRTKITTPR